MAATTEDGRRIEHVPLDDLPADWIPGSFFDPEKVRKGLVPRQSA